MQPERKHAPLTHGIQAYLDHVHPLQKPHKREKPGGCERLSAWLWCMTATQAKAVDTRLKNYQRALQAAAHARVAWLAGLRAQVRAHYEHDPAGAELRGQRLLRLSDRQVRRLSNGELQDRIDAFRGCRDRVESERSQLVDTWRGMPDHKVLIENRATVAHKLLDQRLLEGDIPERFPDGIAQWEGRRFLDADTRRNLGTALQLATTGAAVDGELHRKYQEGNHRPVDSKGKPLPELQVIPSAETVSFNQINNCVEHVLPKPMDEVVVHHVKRGVPREGAGRIAPPRDLSAFL